MSNKSFTKNMLILILLEYNRFTSVVWLTVSFVSRMVALSS